MKFTHANRLLLFCFSMLAFLSPNALAGSEQSASSRQTFVFLGDSITQAGVYVADVECWLLAQGREVQVINAGLSSESATDLVPSENAEHVNRFGFPRPLLSARLKRTLEITQPDVLFACYGMNDGNAMQSAPDALSRYQKAIENLRDVAKEAGVKEVVHVTPPIHDAGPGTTADDPHEQNLVAFSEWLVSKRKDGWKVVDIHGPMRRELDAIRKKSPRFRFQKDGVHPQDAGHWLMAREILSQYFGADLKGINASTDLFKVNGKKVRDLVSKRLKNLHSAYLLKIGHERPGVSGGPDSKTGPSIENAQEKAKKTKAELDLLIQA